MNLSDFSKRAADIIALANIAIKTFQSKKDGTYNCDQEAYNEFRSSGLSFLSNTFGEQHDYYREFDKTTKALNSYQSLEASNVKAGLGVLQAAKAEVLGGWAISVRGLISAEIFTDFIEMAEYLLSEHYKDPSAVIAGSVLEEHLRQLALKNSVPITSTDKKGNSVAQKADTINSALVKASVYNVLQQKNVTAWLDLRNKAAHGHYSEYSEENVSLMLQGILLFMSQFPV
jgi:hypothetical protein